ncbi:MAG: YbaB/EbfC family nucleoid-associated protein [Simkaniaceae bacterium]|nr:YbaB/EbfC family nucleoid-associated protein [Simkaniaceae bacterium]
MGSGFSKMKKQARQFEEQLQKMQEDLKSVEVQGQAGNGLVTATLSGEKELKEISINPECVDKEDIEGLQDLILESMHDAYKKLEEKTPASPLGGAGLPFGF